jgi:hypothetical protein
MFKTRYTKKLEKQVQELKEQLEREKHSNLNAQYKARNWEDKWIDATFVTNANKKKISIPNRGLFIEKSILESKFNLIRNDCLLLQNVKAKDILNYIFDEIK